MVLRPSGTTRNVLERWTRATGVSAAPGGMYYNEFYPGQWLAGTGEHKQIWVHYEDGVPIDADHIGPAIKVTVPGYGVVLLHTGLFTYDFSSGDITFSAGPKIWDEGALDAICAVLSP